MKQLTKLATPFASVAENSNLAGDDIAWLRKLRLQALVQFNEQGLPAKKQEDWKYTSLWNLSQQEYSHHAQVTNIGVSQCEQLALLEDSYRMVIIDGVFADEYSQIAELQSGLTINSFSSGVAEAQAHLGKQVDIKKAGLNALNTLLMNEGVVITVDSDVVVTKPIEILVVNTGEMDNLATHLRHIISLAKNSQATVIEHYVAMNDTASFSNVVSEVVLAENANLDHYKIQQESSNASHIATLAAKQSANSQWRINSISLGAKLARNDIHTQLLGEQAQVVMDGLYLLNNDQHCDFHTRIDHLVANTTSEELFKGVIDDNGHGVFNGKVIVHKDAQHTDSNQQNHNLLLSRSCEIDSKPELEIYADDVKCAHGSTVGKINEDQLFFLRARGLDEVSARSLLTYAFAVDVLERIASDDIRNALSQVIEQRLPRGGKAA